MEEPVRAGDEQAADAAARVASRVLAELFGPPHERAFAIELWDGTIERGGVTDPAFTLVLRRPGALRRMLLPPSQLALGEAYLRDDFDVSGNLEAATALAGPILERLRSPVRLARLAGLLRGLAADDFPDASEPGGRVPRRFRGRRHSRGRDRAAVRSHYDVGNAFYALWLDRGMTYSCAYFEDPAADLDTAQEAKLDLVCRKLRLQPGERLLDIGCGWGSLVLHAATRYGVQALGITLSEPQANLARARIAAAGLADRCRVEVRDYRDLPRGTTFDKVASIGMVEHVGRARLGAYFAAVARVLAPGGLFLNHGIVSRPEPAGGSVRGAIRRVWRQPGFIDRYVFPDGELLPVGEVVTRAERVGFEVRDVEALREHYVRTLRHWVDRLEERHAEAVALAGEETYRIWRLYMSGSAEGFASGRLNVVQTLLARPSAGGAVGLPLTRADLYEQRRRNG